MNTLPIHAKGVRLVSMVAACLLATGCGANLTSASTSSTKFAYVANVMDSTISMYTVSATGQWTPTSPATVATGPQPEAVTVDARGQFAYVCNIGSGTIGMYAINQRSGVLTPLAPATVASGTLPQDFTLHPSGSFAYAANTSDGTVSVFSVDRNTGLLTRTAVVAVPGYDVSSPVAVTVAPSGKFLYVVAQYIEVYSIDQATGGLTMLPETYTFAGHRPFKLTLDPTGTFAFVPDNSSSNVYEFAVDPNAGTLAALPNSPIAAGDQPSWVAINPAGTLAYVSDRLGNAISSFGVAGGTGQMTQLSSNAGSNMKGPWPILVDPSGSLVYVLNEAGFVTSYTANSDGSLSYLSTVATGNIPASFAITSRQ